MKIWSNCIYRTFHFQSEKFWRARSLTKKCSLVSHGHLFIWSTYVITKLLGVPYQVTQMTLYSHIILRKQRLATIGVTSVRYCAGCKGSPIYLEIFDSSKNTWKVAPKWFCALIWFYFRIAYVIRIYEWCFSEEKKKGVSFSSQCGP